MDNSKDRYKLTIHRGQFLKYSFFLPYLKYLILPALAAIFPTIYYYANNVRLVALNLLVRTASIYFLLSIVIYLLLLVVSRKGPLKAAIGTFVFFVFFNLYSLLEAFFRKLDWFQVRFYTMIPLTMFLIIYSVWLLYKLKENLLKQLWNVTVLILIGMIGINLGTIIPGELAKQEKTDQTLAVSSQTTQVNVQDNVNRPDIYYILFDEFSGFEPMREYWHNSKVDDFISFLNSKGFEVFEGSHGSSIFTVHQMAIRLNFQNYPVEDVPDSEMLKIWFDAYANNRVISYLKEKGYTTITFNPFAFPSPPSKPIVSDISYNYNDVPSTNFSAFFDEFGILVADKTMLKELSTFYKKIGTNPSSNLIFFTAKRVSDLRDVASPKFIYAHILLPHSPFLFDENGNENPSSAFQDYKYYLEYYNFALKYAKQLVNNILANADANNPPIIILQSDHGLRNYSENDNFTGQLPNYPEEFKTSILYARLMPGYRSTGSAQEIDPINTFPIVFNYLFDAGIPLQ